MKTDSPVRRLRLKTTPSGVSATLSYASRHVPSGSNGKWIDVSEPVAMRSSVKKLWL